MTYDQLQNAELDWRDEGTPVSVRFDDPYFSRANGLEETRHVFLQGNGLPDRFREGFHIAELGFGTGLNMLAALQMWTSCGQATPLTYTSFEAYPLGATDIARALEAFPEMRDMADGFLAAWARGETAFEVGLLKAEVILGDARDQLARWQGRADAWFLDGFAPAKNPELWGPELMGQVAAHTARGGTLATYTAAGHVRRSLQDVGFEVARVRGYGRKRHMTVGALRDPHEPE